MWWFTYLQSQGRQWGGEWMQKDEKLKVILSCTVKLEDSRGQRPCHKQANKQKDSTSLELVLFLLTFSNTYIAR